MKTILASAALVLALGSASAWADKAAADACANGLNAEGKAIYAASFAAIAGGGDLTGVITANTKSLVQAGTVARGTARASAMAAGQCLSMAK